MSSKWLRGPKKMKKKMIDNACQISQACNINVQIIDTYNNYQIVT